MVLGRISLNLEIIFVSIDALFVTTDSTFFSFGCAQRIGRNLQRFEVCLSGNTASQLSCDRLRFKFLSVGALLASDWCSFSTSTQTTSGNSLFLSVVAIAIGAILLGTNFSLPEDLQLDGFCLRFRFSLIMLLDDLRGNCGISTSGLTKVSAAIGTVRDAITDAGT